MSSSDPNAPDYYDPLGSYFKPLARNLTYGRVYATRAQAEFEAEMTALQHCEAVGSRLSRALEQKKTSAEVLLMGVGRERTALLGRLENINRALQNQDLLQDGIDYLTAVGGTALGIAVATGAAVASAPLVIAGGVVLGVVTVGNTLLRPDPGIETAIGGTSQAVLDFGGTAQSAIAANAPLVVGAPPLNTAAVIGGRIVASAPFVSSVASVASAVTSSAPLLEYSARSVEELTNLRAQVEKLDATKVREAFGLDKQDTLDQIDRTIDAEKRYQEAQKAYDRLANGRLMDINSTCVERLTKEIADLTSPKPVTPPPRKRPGGG